MDSEYYIAGIVAIGATVLGALEIYKNGDGTVMTAVAAIWGTVLGYVFGKKTTP